TPTYFSCYFILPHSSTTDVFSFSLHDALPISAESVADDIRGERFFESGGRGKNVVDFQFSPASPVSLGLWAFRNAAVSSFSIDRSEEHTSEIQSRENLVCRLLLENKINKNNHI